MNEERSVLRRLLNIYPADALKKKWAQEGNPLKDDLLDKVVNTATPDDIRSFAKQSQGLTKQNTFVFDLKGLNKAVPVLLQDADDLSTPEERAAGKHFYMANLRYKVFMRPQNEESEVIFKWPVRVLLDHTRMVVRCTTMEKNIKTYFPKEVNVIALSRAPEEEDLIKEIREKVHALTPVEVCDLNKGVKHLWATDVIDSPSTRYKGSKSTITETMDGEMLIKRDQPATYQKLLDAPLFKCPFFLLKPASKIPPHFSVNPTTGELNFTTFSPSEDHIEYVLGEIAKHN